MVSVLAQVPKLPWSFDPLIAEARRRARQRHVRVVAAVIVLAGGGAAGGILASGSSYAASRPLQSALVESRQLVAQSRSQFVRRGTFAASVVLTNEAGAPVTLEDARAVLPRRSPFREIGARLTAFKLVRCRVECFPGFITSQLLRPPYGPERPGPLSLGPGGRALVQLNFGFAACWNRALPEELARHVAISYRTPDGTVIRERVALGVGLTGQNYGLWDLRAGCRSASGSRVASRPIDAALVKSSRGTCGESRLPTYGGCNLGFVPSETFALAVVVTNKAAAPITLETAHVRLGHQSPLHQIGARFTVFEHLECRYGPCPVIVPRHPPPYGSEDISPPPYGPERPTPLSLAPGRQALAQLDFQFVSCWSHPLPRQPVVREVTLVYRSPHGTRIRQRLQVSAFDLQGASDCRR